VDEREFQRCCAVLGVSPAVTAAELDRAHVRRAFALLKAGEAQKAELRAAHAALAAELQRRSAVNSARAEPAAAPGAVAVPVYVAPSADEGWARLSPTSFDSWIVNTAALPVLVALAWAVNASPFGFFLRGFHVWMHEFGHATVAWLSGHRALPLPIGWTNYGETREPFVYFGVLFLLGVLAWAGWRERKIWPVLLAVALVPLQAWLTWRLPEDRRELWLAFGGVGGEFYLSAVLMGLFFVQFPEKFRWGLCRYVCAFLGASSFLNAWLLWRKIARFEETIPYGSMVNGEEDAGGDMNILREHGWRETQITHVYTSLGFWCIVGVAVVWLVFATRLDRVVGDFVARIWPENWRAD